MATLTDWLVARGWEAAEVSRGARWIRAGRALMLQPAYPAGPRAERSARARQIEVAAVDMVGLSLRDESGTTYTTCLRPSGATGISGVEGRDLSHDWDVWAAAEIV